MIDVYVIAGFLGAGKTSFIKYLLNNYAFKKMMLLENEFGEVGIDAAFFKNDLKIKEINNGCICCSLKGDFKKALDDIASFDIETLIIEPSGVGKLMDILGLVAANDKYKLKANICLINVKTAYKYHQNYKTYFDDQIISANTLILTHLDKADKKDIDKTLEMIQTLNDEAYYNLKDYHLMKIDDLLTLISNDTSPCLECLYDHDGHCDCMKHHHEYKDNFDKLIYHFNRPIEIVELNNFFNKLDENIIRAKGYISNKEGKMFYLNYIFDEFDIFEGELKSDSLISIIGKDLNKKALIEALDRL